LDSFTAGKIAGMQRAIEVARKVAMGLDGFAVVDAIERDLKKMAPPVAPDEKKIG
jgi:hypothetical protein